MLIYYFWNLFLIKLYNGIFRPAFFLLDDEMMVGQKNTDYITKNDQMVFVGPNPIIQDDEIFVNILNAFPGLYLL